MKIAVTHCGNEKKQKIYLDWLNSFDQKMDLVTLSVETGVTAINEYDGIVVTGGDDVDPLFSKAEPVELVQEVNRERDQFEFILLEKAFRNRTPVLGICRGMQVINVHLGGTLIADLWHDGFRKHETKSDEPEVRHTVSIKNGTELQSIVKIPNGEINSYHHQGIKILAETLLPTSLSDDGVIESIEWKEKNDRSFLLAVQWHPERMHDRSNPMTQKIGEAFFDAVHNYHTQNNIRTQ